MARQLPAQIRDNRSLALPASSTSAVSRAAAAVAPDLIRIAERWATERLRQRSAQDRATPPATAGEALHLSEVEIDFSVPFVRKVTMRKLSAWQTTPVIAEPPTPQRSEGRMRRVGLIGATGLIAVAAGLLAKRAGALTNGRSTIIDVPGRQRD